MSEQKELQDSYWLYSTRRLMNNEPMIGISEKPEEGTTEYRRTPSLPDVMDDGYVVASNAEHRIIVAIWGFAHSDCWGVTYIAQEFYKDKWCTLTGIPSGMMTMLCLPDLSNYHVQDGKIVRRDG